MDSVLTGYVRALRAAGVQASTAETLDAAQAMGLVGYADRDRLKAALGVVLAKSADELALHDRVFDQFFSRPAPAAQADADSPASAHATPHTGRAEVDAMLALADAASGDAQAQDGLDQAMARAAQAAGVDEIRFASQAAYFVRQTLKALGVDALDAHLQRLRDQAEGQGHGERRGESGAAEQAGIDALAAARDRLQRRARRWVDHRFELYGRPATEAFMTEVAVARPLGRMSPPDMDRMKAAVARMAKRLAARHSRRRLVLLRGQLDFRRTLRANAGHDAVPVDLYFKHRRRDKPRIVAVCDVSGSVAAHVRFLLLFLYALQGIVGDLRCFAFSHSLKDVGPALESLPFDDAMAHILREVGGGATDYGQALADLRDHHWQAIDRHTTVLVLGDGRSNQTDPRLDLFAELAARARRVVWLCPEPPGRWGTGDSAMLQYRPLCTSLTHCASAADLERVIDEALDSHH